MIFALNTAWDFFVSIFFLARSTYEINSETIHILFILSFPIFRKDYSILVDTRTKKNCFHITLLLFVISVFGNTKWHFVISIFRPLRTFWKFVNSPSLFDIESFGKLYNMHRVFLTLHCFNENLNENQYLQHSQQLIIKYSIKTLIKTSLLPFS